MQNFVYPNSDLDRAKQLMRVLGSFWAMTYEAKDQLRAFTTAIAAGAQQNVDNLAEVADSLSRRDLPIFHTENWHPIKLKKSQANLTAANNYKFDDVGLIFNDRPPIIFDAMRRTDFYAFPISEKLVTACQLYDRILFPTFSLISGVDFVIDNRNSAIVFTQNPFDLPGVNIEQEYGDTATGDETITLWAFKAKLDYLAIFNQFAYAIDAKLKSTENAKNFLNAIFDGLIAGGATAAVLDAALSAIFDIPLAKSDGEVIEVLELDNRGLIIVTDKNVYRFAGTASPVVTLGQTLRAGDRLVNAFEIVHLNRGNIPNALSALALDSGFTAGCFYSDLIFENKDVPIIVDEHHPSGFTYVKFPIGGFPPDVDKFFDEMHARGIESLNIPVEAGCEPPPTRTGTLAHVLDRRTNPVGEPVADDLPNTINPLKFIVENVLKNNVTVVIARISELGKNKLGLYNIRHIRQLFPPHVAVIFNYIINGEINVIDPENINEEINTFVGAEPLTDAVPDVLINDRGVTVRVISGSCQ